MSALQGAIAAGELTMDAMNGVAAMVTSTFNRASQERQLQSNILEGMVRSAQDAKKMEIDSFFKGKELELRGEQLKLDSTYRNAQLGIDSAQLKIQSRKADMEEERIRLAEEKIVEADKYRPWIKNLGQERALLGKSLEEELRKAKDDQDRLLAEINGREASGANPAILGMSPVERIKDELNPNGKHAQLKLLQTEKARALEEKQRKLKDIDEELRHVTGGGEPGVYVPIPKPKTTSSINTSGENSEYLYQTDDDGYTYPSLLPKLPNSASDDAKAALLLKDEEIAMLEGQVPSYDEMQPISKDEEAKEFTKKYDSKLLGAIYDKNTRIQDIPALIAELSPESKVKLEESKIIRQSEFLYDYAESKSYLFNKKYESDSKASEQFSDDYIRSGGAPEEIMLMERDARNKLAELFGEAVKPIAPDEYRDENQRDLYIAQKYNEWVDGRLTKQKEVIKDDASSGIKNGSIIAPDGSLPGFRRIASTDAKDESLDDLLGKYTISSDGRINKEKEDKDIELYDQFSKGFIKTEGGFDRRTFAETALQQPALLYAILGNDRINLESSEVGYSKKEVEDVTNANYKKLIEKTKKLQAPDAFRMWKEASKFIK
jgi:hypothetical protein